MSATLHLGDCLEVMKGLPDGSVDAVVTDPPYAETYNYLWEPLGRESRRLLIVGGSLITLLGHYQVPFVTSVLGQYLRYWWELAMVHRSYGARLPGKWVAVRWKPALWYVKERRVGHECPLDCVDVTHIGTKAVGNIKANHEWGQPVEWFRHYIERLTPQTGTVLDPFMGSGTTGVACVQTGRNFIGMEIEPRYFEIAQKRIAEAQQQPSLLAVAP